MDTLMEGTKPATSTPTSGARSGGRKLPPRKSQLERATAPTTSPVAARSDVAIDVPIFTPPFLGARVAKGISLDEIAGYINETALFRNQWQFRPAGRPRDRRGVQGADPAQLRERARRGEGRGLARPGGGVGLLPGELRGRRPDRLEGRRPARRAAALPLPAPAQGPLPLHLGLLPPGRQLRPRLRGVPRHDRRQRGHRARSASCSRRTSTPSTSSPTACRSR